MPPRLRWFDTPIRHAFSTPAGDAADDADEADISSHVAADATPPPPAPIAAMMPPDISLFRVLPPSAAAFSAIFHMLFRLLRFLAEVLCYAVCA